MSTLLLAAALAAASAPPSPAPASDSGPEVLVNLYHPRADTVIVRGRAEGRRQTPAAITQVDPVRVASADDLATLVPGLWMVNDQDPGTNILSIRAATTDRLQQASVAFVLDGVPLADTELFTARLFDVERIEVLKGPQGALFGKNAAGGVVSIATRFAGAPAVLERRRNGVRTTPRWDLADGYVEARAGDGALREVQAARSFAGPGDLVFRAAGLWSAADGWIRNTTLNKTVDATETRMLRLGVAGTVAAFDWDARAHWMEEDGGAAWASSNNVTGLNGGLLDGVVLTNPIGDYEGRARRRWGQASLRVTGPLLDGTVKLVLAQDAYAKRWSEELDYRPGALTFFGFPAFPNGIQPIAQPIDIEATTAQVRWDRDLGERWRVQGGLFHQSTAKDRVDDFGPLLFGGAPPAYETRSRQSAMFGGVSFEPNDALLFEAQGRVDRDDRSQTIDNSLTGARIERRSAVFERFQPRVAARWTIGNALNLYASYGEAFRPGGFNPAPGPASIWRATYRPEITTSAEIGLKTADLPLGGRLEIAVYDNDVSDWQNYTFIDGQSVTLSVDAVRVRGTEISGAFSPLGGVTLGGDWARADTRIVRFIATDPLLGSPATRDYSGKRLPNTPRETARVWAKANFIAGANDLTIRLDLNHAGETFYEIDNVLRSPPRWWADFELAAQLKEWTLRLNARNLTDERWAISAFGQGMTGLLAGLGPGGPFDTFTINRGRQVSVSLRREF